MNPLLALTIALVAAAAQPASEVPPPDTTSVEYRLDRAVERAIAQFQPFVTPHDRDLLNVTVGIDWDPNGCGDAKGCKARLDRTAGYLFHLLKRRGADVVLSHAPGDERSAVPYGRGGRYGALAKGKCDIVLAVNCRNAGSAGQHSPPSEGNERDGGTATLLQAALGADWNVAPTSPAPPDSAASELSLIAGSASAFVSVPVRDAGVASWKSAREDALALCGAIAKLAAARGINRSSDAPEKLPGFGRAARIARDLVPEGNLPAERAQWLCDLVLRLMLTNPSLVYANVSAQADSSGVRLTGAASTPNIGRALTSALRAVGIDEVTDEVRALPDREHLGDRLYGACRVPSALTRSQPNESARLQTELLFGEPVFLLDRDRDFLLLLSGDGYWGWAPGDAVATMDAIEFHRYLAADEGIAEVDIDTNGLRIPRGARVRTVGASRVRKRVLVPGGDAVFAPRRSIAPAGDEDITAQRVRAALDLLHTPYVFGGKSPWGLDCSGLVTNVATRCGQPAARDANQQALEGTLTATAWFREGLQAGDQVFFLDQSGKVYHTGIAISPTHILHSAPPAVQIGSFVKGDRLYDERLDRDFFIAKRP